jgi:hypothetical protein
VVFDYAPRDRQAEPRSSAPPREEWLEHARQLGGAEARPFVAHLARDAPVSIDALMHLAARVGARVVAEGVGDENDLKAVRTLGVDLLQGFHFARPAPATDLLAHPLVVAAQPYGPA